MQAVILAAGRGKRLHPITKNRSKAMLPIIGKPMVARVLDTLISNGIQDFILVTSPDDHEIAPYFKHNYSRNFNIKVVHQFQPLGMGHALMQAILHIEKDFMLSACDNLINEVKIKQMLDIWKTDRINGILTTLKVSPPEIFRMGMVEIDGNYVTRIVEKPTLEDATSNIGSPPFYIFSLLILNHLDELSFSTRGEYELQGAVQRLIDQDGLVRAFPIERRTDLTTIVGKFGRKKFRGEIYQSRLYRIRGKYGYKLHNRSQCFP